MLGQVHVGMLVICNVLLSTNGEERVNYAAKLISKCDYPFEVHRNIQTDDGYLLTMQRLPSQTKDDDDNNVPVLMMHGLMGSAEHFLLDCNQSLGFMLAEQGFDVWLGNLRTVSYSRHHAWLDPASREYWDITLDEFGNYDLPKLIDYVLETSGHEKLMYIGHSQGNLIYYVMCSNKPEYADKVHLFVNLSPVATLTNCPHPWGGSLCKQSKPLQAWIDRYGFHEWTFGRNFIRQYGDLFFNTMPIMPMLYRYLVYLVSGLPPSHVVDAQFRNLLLNCPEGIAAKQFLHGCQMLNSKSFRKWDFGSAEANRAHYGRTQPPAYNLSSTTTPTAIYYCQNDWFLSPLEVPNIVKQIPNVVDVHAISIAEFSHFDFVIGHLAPVHLYPRIIALMNKYRSEQRVELSTRRRRPSHGG